MLNNIPPRLRALLALVAGALITLGVVELVDRDGDGRTDRVIINLGGHAAQPGGVPAGPAKLKLNEPGVDVLEAAKRNDAGGHIGADDETPPAVPTDELLAGARAQGRAAQADGLPDLTPLAAPFQAGCSTRLVGNYSARSGVRPRIIVLHYTVSRNRPGRSDVDGITAYFNGRGSSASSHYVVDADGNCNYIVRETSKAWTQAGFNPWAISIEQIAYGDEGRYANAAGYAKLGRIVRDAARRWKIPLRRGRVVGCSVIAAGIVDHRQLGRCGGGHNDVSPFAGAVEKVIATARKGSTANSPLTAVERGLAAKRCFHRGRHLRLKGPARTKDVRWARHYRDRLRRRVVAIPGDKLKRPARRALLGRYASGAACR